MEKAGLGRRKRLVTMETLLELAVASFVVGFTGAMMPGPVLIATILHSAKKGYMTGPLVTVGHAFVELMIALLLGLGLVLIIGSLEVRVIIRFLGGLGLMWMGLEASKYSKNATVQGLVENESRAKVLMYGPISLGLLMSISNPYWWVWWVTVGNTFLIEGVAVAGLLGAATFYFSHIISDLTWYTIVSSSIGKSRKVISDKVYRYVLIGCSIFLIGLGIIFLIEGLNLILPCIK